MPLLHFQRPTARFDEPALFSAAEKRLRHFVGRTAKAFDATGEAFSPGVYMATQAASARADEISTCAITNSTLCGTSATAGTLSMAL